MEDIEPHIFTPWKYFVIADTKFGGRFIIAYLRNLIFLVLISKSNPCTGLEGSRRLRLPHLKTIGTGKWLGFYPYAPAAFTPHSHSHRG
jgi:hypothetical protein